MIACLLTGPAGASVIYVKHHQGATHNGQSWSTAFDKVQEAVDAAVSGDEIWVAAGTYTENVVLTSGVALYGGFAGSETSRSQRNVATNVSVVDGNWAGPAVEVARSASATTRIDGLKITNGRAVCGGGIYINQSASPIIINNNITRNAADCEGGGIYCNYSAAPVIANNIITCNGAARGGGGINTVTGATKITNNFIASNTARYGGAVCCGDSNTSNTASHEYIVNNTICANAASYGGAIYCWGYTSASISNNIIAYNSGGITKAAGTGAPVLKKNDLYANSGGNYSGLSAGSTDITSDPKITSARYGELHLLPGSPCINNGNNTEVIAGYLDIDNQTRVQGTVDIGADESDGTTWPVAATIVRVSPTGNDSNSGATWAQPKRTIQAAIDSAAQTGGEVWVKTGTYHECLEMRDLVYIYGGFAGTETTRAQRNLQQGSLVDADGEGPVVTASKLGYRTSAIDGFTLSNGSDINGSGILCDHASPIVTNNTISGNEASGCGGGVYLANSSALLKNNTIQGNEAKLWGGGVFSEHSNAEITANRIDSNTATNAGAGVYTSADTTARLVNNLITANRESNGFPWIWGSGIAIASYSPPDLICNTFANNTLNGMAVYTGVYGVLKMRSNILAFNGAGIRADKNATISLLSNNCLYHTSGYSYSGLSAGTNDISLDPLFTNAAGGIFSLQAGSPCRDAADAASAPSEDIIGTPRPLDGDANMVSLPDIGCYEYSRGFVSAAGALASDGSSPVALTGMVTTASLPGAFYMENSDRTRGIGVLGSVPGSGKTVTVEGVMTTSHGERMLSAYNVIPGSEATIPAPYGIPIGTLGGAAQGRQNATYGWQAGSWTASASPNNIGLLVRSFGKVVGQGSGCFYIDDGSGVHNFDLSRIGLKVTYAYTLPAVGTWVAVTGISSCEVDSTALHGELVPVILTRQSSDVSPI